MHLTKGRTRMTYTPEPGEGSGDDGDAFGAHAAQPSDDVGGLTGIWAAAEADIPDPDMDATEEREERQRARESWGRVDLTDTVNAVQSGEFTGAMPTLAHIDGVEQDADVLAPAPEALFYAGKVHTLFGIPGTCKTWLAAFALAERIRADEHVVFLDLEDTPETIVERLVKDLHVPAGAVLERFHYFRPSAWDEGGLREFAEYVCDVDASMVVLDSTGEGMALAEVKANADDEVAGWMRRVARPLASWGAAVLLLDHVPKSDENALMPTGSQRKAAAVDGVTYSVRLDGLPPKRGRAGHVAVVCGRDRVGRHGAGDRVAELFLTPDADGRTEVTLRSPAGGGGKPLDPGEALGVRLLGVLRRSGSQNLTQVADALGVDSRGSAGGPLRQACTWAKDSEFITEGKDGRAKVLTLTDAGRELLDEGV